MTNTHNKHIEWDPESLCKIHFHLGMGPQNFTPNRLACIQKCAEDIPLHLTIKLEYVDDHNNACCLHPLPHPPPERLLQFCVLVHGSIAQSVRPHGATPFLDCQPLHVQRFCHTFKLGHNCVVKMNR